jgi:hypothetical protein
VDSQVNTGRLIGTYLTCPVDRLEGMDSCRKGSMFLSPYGRRASERGRWWCQRSSESAEFRTAVDHKWGSRRGRLGAVSPAEAGSKRSESLDVAEHVRRIDRRGDRNILWSNLSLDSAI